MYNQTRSAEQGHVQVVQLVQHRAPPLPAHMHHVKDCGGLRHVDDGLEDVREVGLSQYPITVS